MAQRGRKPLLPSPVAPGPEAVPAAIRSAGTCADGSSMEIFDAAMDGRRELEAKAVCSACPAREMCLRYAIDNEPYGVWGGMTPGERAEIRPADLMYSPEDRRAAYELRVEIRSGRNHEHIARDRGVNVRTLTRWIARDSAAA